MRNNNQKTEGVYPPIASVIELSNALGFDEKRSKTIQTVRSALSLLSVSFGFEVFRKSKVVVIDGFAADGLPEPFASAVVVLTADGWKFKTQESLYFDFNPLF